MVGGRLDIVVDVEGLPSLFLDEPVTEEHFAMPKDHFEELIGNGDAKVSVSLNMKDSSYGTGFGAHVTVTLTCNQDEESLVAARALAGGLAQEFLEASFEEAHELLVARNETKKEEAAVRKKPPARGKGRGRGR